MNNSNILLVDDEQEIRELVGLYIKKEGFNFFEAKNALEAFEQVEKINPHLIILDVYLPDLNGIELCRRIRNITTAPILFLSCKDSEIDKVTGLSVGADDYIGKPFSMYELIARIKAHLRRHLFFFQPSYSEKPIQILRSSSITLHLEKHECHSQNNLIWLTSKEFQLLYFFMSHPQQVFSAEHLLEKVWGYNSVADIKTVIVHIGKLRKKLAVPSINSSIILTIRGAGYKFNEETQKI